MNNFRLPIGLPAFSGMNLSVPGRKDDILRRTIGIRETRKTACASLIMGISPHIKPKHGAFPCFLFNEIQLRI